MKKVKYIVGKNEAFGDYEDGAETEAYLIAFDGTQGLLFHPCSNTERKRSQCATVSVCSPIDLRHTKFEHNGCDWSYVNLSRKEERMFERMIESEKRREKRKKK